MEDQENNNTINENNAVEREQRYRNLLNLIEEINESNDVGIQTVRHIKNILTEANTLNDQTDIETKLRTSSDEVLLDSYVLSQVSDILLKCTKGLNVLCATYDPIEFGTKISNNIKTDNTVQQLDFLKLIDHSRDIVSNSIEYSFVYGAFDMVMLREPKEKKQRVKERQAPKKALIAVDKTQDQVVDGNEAIVLYLYKVLQNEYKANGEAPLKYYDFIIDKASYAVTIENMFYFSFLMRDGKVSIDVDIAGVPFIRPTHKQELKAFRNHNGVNIQTIISMEMDQWNKLKSDMPEQGFLQRHRKPIN